MSSPQQDRSEQTQDEQLAANDARLAALIGFAQEDSAHAQRNQEYVAVAEESDFDFVSADPRDASRGRPLWKHPASKATLILASTSIFAFFAHALFAGLANPFTEKAERQKLQEFSAPVQVKDKENLGDYKAELALGDQVKALQENRNVKPVKKLVKPEKPKPILKPVLIARQGEEPPRQMYVPRPVLRPVPRPAPPPSLSPKPVPTLSPEEQLAILAQAGSYGQTSGGVPSATLAQSNKSQSDSNPDENLTNDTAPVSTEGEMNTLELADVLNLQQDLPSSAGRDQIIRVGTSVEAEVAQPLIVEELGKSSLQPPKTLALVLKQPLKGINDSVLLPVGAEITCKVLSLTNNGLITLVPESAIYIQAEQIVTQVTFPQGALTVMNQSGAPLYAQQLNRNDDQTEKGNTFGRFADGALQGATSGVSRGNSGDVVNRSLGQGVREALSRRQKRSRRGLGLFLAKGTIVTLSANRTFALSSPDAIQPSPDTIQSPLDAIQSSPDTLQLPPDAVQPSPRQVPQQISPLR